MLRIFRLSCGPIESPNRLQLTASVRLSRAYRYFRFFGAGIFSFLCLRFFSASLHEDYSSSWSVFALFLSFTTVSAIRPTAALFAFTLLVPVLLAFGQLQIILIASPLSLAFVSLWIGRGLNSLAVSSHHRIPAASLPSSLSVRVSRIKLIETEVKSRYSIAYTIVDTLIFALSASVLFQFVNRFPSPHFWAPIFARSVFGFSDTNYFLTSAFIWLQGLYYFRFLISATLGESSPQTAKYPINCDVDMLTAIQRWVPIAFNVYTVLLIAAFIFQSITHIPGTPRYYIPFFPESSLPFEDSHAFGSIVVALLAFYLTRAVLPGFNFSTVHMLAIAALLMLVVASWSRAAWMTAIFLIFCVACIPLSKARRWFFAAFVCSTLLFFSAIWGTKSNGNPYLYRLGTLLSLDRPRLNLYHKAFGIIFSRPLFGYGIGSFYNTSVRFARPGDPLGGKPDFAHNFLLQIQAEQGIVVSTLFVFLVLWVLWAGFRLLFLTHYRAMAPEARNCICASVSLVSYLATQMTANSLNVYISNQFFFWLLMACVISGSQHVMFGRFAKAPAAS